VLRLLTFFVKKGRVEIVFDNIRREEASENQRPEMDFGRRLYAIE
jgi:hypothetical protein